MNPALSDRAKTDTSPRSRRTPKPPIARRPRLGAHMSIAGGYHHAIEAAVAAGCDAVQVFTKNNNQWRAKPLSDEDVQLFANAVKQSGIETPFAHNCYLINLASPDRALWIKSIDAMVIEVQRCDALGLAYLVTHPGSYVHSSERQGLQRISSAIDKIHAQTRGARTQILLEITAGQGTNLGHRFEHLSEIIQRVRSPERLGVCFDTCHAFAAGYGLAPRHEYDATMAELNRTVGITSVKAFHLNDSKRERGSRVDRHEHIGRGQLGLESFRNLLNDPRFLDVPMCLETPKGLERGKDLDKINLAKLRRLVKCK